MRIVRGTVAGGDLLQDLKLPSVHCAGVQLSLEIRGELIEDPESNLDNVHLTSADAAEYELRAFKVGPVQDDSGFLAGSC